MGNKIINALAKKYEYEIASAKANIQAYIDSPVGIGEHPDLVNAVDSEMAKLAEATDKLETIVANYPSEADAHFLIESQQERDV
tara:strand:+ start:134 stop:385 length:252 start_codon:yes stop_codon:yes gene_type:complete